MSEMSVALDRLRFAVRTLPGVLAGFSEAESEQRPSPERWTKKGSPRSPDRLGIELPPAFHAGPDHLRAGLPRLDGNPERISAGPGGVYGSSGSLFDPAP